MASFAIPAEASKELGGLPPTQFLQLAVLSDKYGKRAAKPHTQNFPVKQNIIFEWGPCRAQAKNRYSKFLLPLLFLSHYWSVTWCLDLVALHAQAHQPALEAAWVSPFHSPDCFWCSVLFQHPLCSVLHFHYIPIIAGEAGGGRGHLQVGSHFSHTESYRDENKGVKVSSQSLRGSIALSLHYGYQVTHITSHRHFPVF